MKNFLLFKDYLIEKFGAPFYRVPIDLALGCPHKDINGDGCIFCAEDGARARHLSRNLDLKTQAIKGLDYVEKRYKAKGNYIAYFQSYTNTNAPIEALKKLYEEVLSFANFKMIIISTRPDCLPDETLKYLSEINKKYELWIELGVQTANDKTLELIKRGHDFATTENAVKKLASLNIKTAAHIILGLPGEGISDHQNTIYKLSELPFSGIKIHNLLILKKTPLAKRYNLPLRRPCGSSLQAINIKPLNEYEYASALIDIIRRTPATWPIMRINADANPEDLIAPKWSLTKGQFLELIKTTMKDNNFHQGDLAGQKPSNKKQDDLISFLKIKTDDNSYTFYNPSFKENYHTLAGANSEAIKKFIEPSKLGYRLQASGDWLQNLSTKSNSTKSTCLPTYQPTNLLDIGFGLGYNAIAAIKEALKQNAPLKITSLEFNDTSLTLAQNLYKKDSLEFEIISELTKNKFWKHKSVEIQILFGDARTTIQQLTGKFDIVFMDGFSTTKNPELWTYDFINKITKKLNPNGVIVTYSSAFPVRGAFLKNKLFVGTTKPFGRKRGGTIASFNQENIETPLPEKKTNIILKSTTGTPYRDPTLNWPTKQILQYRDKLTKRLKSKNIPTWYHPKKQRSS